MTTTIGIVPLRKRKGLNVTTTIGTVHISPHEVCVEDPEFQSRLFIRGKLIWSDRFNRDIAELWNDDTGVCWREVNDRKRSDLLTYGHAKDESDAIRAVVRQAEQG